MHKSSIVESSDWLHALHRASPKFSYCQCVCVCVCVCITYGVWGKTREHKVNNQKDTMIVQLTIGIVIVKIVKSLTLLALHVIQDFRHVIADSSKVLLNFFQCDFASSLSCFCTCP